MPSSPEQIMAYAAALPEGALLHPKALLHLGTQSCNRPGVVTAREEGERCCESATVSTFALWRPASVLGPPSASKKVIASLSALWGETIVPCGGTAANALGLTTQSAGAGRCI